MTPSKPLSAAGAPGSAYAALGLGLSAVATFTMPPIPVLLGVLGLSAALHARGVLRRTESGAGTVPSLLGAILSVIGLLAGLPWVISAVFGGLGSL